MRTQQDQTRPARSVIAALVAATSLVAPGIAGARPQQAAAPAQAAPYSPIAPGELFASNLGIYYRLEPYGSSQGARLTRPPLPGSAAAQILLEPGDLIIALDSQPIFGPNDVLNHVAQTSVQFINIRTGLPQTNWVQIPAPGPVPPFPNPNPNPFPPPAPPLGPLPYTLGVTTVLTTVGNAPVPASPYLNQPNLAMRPAYGLQVTSVSPGSAAHRSGLEPGDVILSANGQPMSDAHALRRVIASSNGVLNLVVRDVRNPGHNVTVTVTLDPTGGQIYASPAPPQ
ncbi:PDZ domain-containing protein [Tautonia sociabilis]|nr:PDZ domain-containing protein [Tautonia sociabilis]